MAGYANLNNVVQDTSEDSLLGKIISEFNIDYIEGEGGDQQVQVDQN